MRVPLIAAVLVLAPGAAAAAPIGVVGDPLDRAALAAAPAVYTLEAIFPAGDDPVQGLAFAVSGSGHLLATNHVIESGGTRATRVLVRRAGTSAPTWVAQVVTTDADNDLALLKIAEAGAPALLLDTHIGGGVAAFGLEGDGLVVRKGSVGSTGPVGPPVNGIVTRVGVDIQEGDSGAPAVGENGRVQGMMQGYFKDQDLGFMKAAPTLEAFVRNAGVTNAEGATTVAFRHGISALSRLDAGDAEAWFREVRAAYPNHPTVDAALVDSHRLAASGFRAQNAPRDEGLLAMTAVIFGVAALWCGGALLARRPRQDGEMA